MSNLQDNSSYLIQSAQSENSLTLIKVVLLPVTASSILCNLLSITSMWQPGHVLAVSDLYVGFPAVPATVMGLRCARRLPQIVVCPRQPDQQWPFQAPAASKASPSAAGVVSL